MNHKDGNKQNDRVENLEWITQQENIAHAARTGLYPHGERHHCAKLDDDRVRQIRSLGGVITRAELAQRFHVSDSTIDSVLSRRTWKHLV